MNIFNLLTDATITTNSGFFNTVIEIVKGYWLQFSAIISVPVLVTYLLKIILTLVKNKTKAKSLKQLFDLVAILPGDLQKAVLPIMMDETIKISKEVKDVKNITMAFAETILNTEENAELRILFYEKLDELNMLKPSNPVTHEEIVRSDNGTQSDIENIVEETDEVIEYEENKATAKISLE